MVSISSFTMRPTGNAGPVGHHRGDRLLVHMRIDHALFRIARLEQVEFLADLLARVRRTRRRAVAFLAHLLQRQDVAQAANLGDQLLLGIPFGLQRSELFLQRGDFAVDLPETLVGRGAEIPSLTSADFSVSRAAIATRASSIIAGVADWLIATRADAVSSRLTALSGSYRAGM